MLSAIFCNVVFDDYNQDYTGVWSQVCRGCVDQYNLPKQSLSELAGAPICGVAGCDRVADYYIDFVHLVK